MPAGSVKVVLDERGKSLVDCASWRSSMAGWMQEGRDVAFVIGGADGLARKR